ncbi:MAG: hypothetical protein FWE79_01485 [Firmicutes bacterium]|nr:hypothetical protein [Bacillota bacterium]
MKKRNKIAWLSAIVGLSVNAVVAIVIVLIGNYSHLELRILGTTFALFALTVAVVLSITRYYSSLEVNETKNTTYERKHEVRKHLLVYFISALFFFGFLALMLILAIWEVMDLMFFFLWGWLTIGLGFISSVHIAHVLPKIIHSDVVRITSIVNIVISATFYFLLLIILWFNPHVNFFEGFWLRLNLVVLILAILGNTVRPILMKVFPGELK